MASPGTKSASSRLAAMRLNASPNSVASNTPISSSVMPSGAPALTAARRIRGWIGFVRLTRRAIRLTRGLASRSSAIRLDERDATAVAGDVASGLRRARDDPEVDGVAPGHEHDRDIRRRPLGGEGHGRPDPRDNEVHPEPDELCDESGQPLQVPLRRARLDAEAASLGPAAVGQASPKRVEVARWQNALRDEADGGQLSRGLPCGHARPIRDGKRAADERAPRDCWTLARACHSHDASLAPHPRPHHRTKVQFLERNATGGMTTADRGTSSKGAG